MKGSIQQYYFIGILFLVIFLLINFAVTKSLNPFAMAKEKKSDNKNLNASLVQMIVFTMLTIFAYTVVFAGRALHDNGNALLPSFEKGWLNVPSNLLLLMGISVGTGVGSRAIAHTQEITEDFSSLYQDRKGRTDLIKIQMLVWTVIAVVIYLTILYRFMQNTCYLGLGEGVCKGFSNTLPDIDSSFLGLLGVSQGGYLLNKLSEESLSLSSITIEPATLTLTADSPKQQLTVKAKDDKGNEIPHLSASDFQWKSDNTEVAEVDANGVVTRKKAGKCNITASSKTKSSNQCKVECT